jgi:hypothetical protein
MDHIVNKADIEARNKKRAQYVDNIHKVQETRVKGLKGDTIFRWYIIPNHRLVILNNKGDYLLTLSHPVTRDWDKIKAFAKTTLVALNNGVLLLTNKGKRIILNNNQET